MDLFIQKRVAGFFAGDGGGGAVTGVDGGFSRKSQDFFLDSGKKQVTVAAGKVPATDPIGKEDIPAEKTMMIGKIKAEAAGAVSGDEKKLGAGPAGGEGIGLPEELGGANRPEAPGEAEGKHGVGLQTEEGGVGMIIHGATGPVREIRGVPDVVPVAVGKQEGIRLQLLFFEKFEESLGGIDGQAVAAKVQEVGVGGGEATRIN